MKMMMTLRAKIPKRNSETLGNCETVGDSETVGASEGTGPATGDALPWMKLMMTDMLILKTSCCNNIRKISLSYHTNNHAVAFISVSLSVQDMPDGI